MKRRTPLIKGGDEDSRHVSRAAEAFAQEQEGDGIQEGETRVFLRVQVIECEKRSGQVPS